MKFEFSSNCELIIKWRTHKSYTDTMDTTLVGGGQLESLKNAQLWLATEKALCLCHFCERKSTSSKTTQWNTTDRLSDISRHLLCKNTGQLHSNKVVQQIKKKRALNYSVIACNTQTLKFNLSTSNLNCALMCYTPTISVVLTFGMLTLDQKSSRCSLIFSGLYLEYRIANSVNMPMWALSKPGQQNQI